MKMKKAALNNKEAAPPVVGRRSLRNIKPAEEDVKPVDTSKKRKIILKKDDAKKDDPKKDEIKKDDSKRDEIKKDDSKKDETKKDNLKKDESKKDDSKKDESKKDDSKRDDSKKDESKKDESKKDDSKKDDSKKDDSKKDDSKKDESKMDETKKGDFKKENQREQTELEMKRQSDSEDSVVTQKPSAVKSPKGGKKRPISEAEDEEEEGDDQSKDEIKDSNISKDVNEEFSEEMKDGDKNEKKKNGKAENGKKSRGRKKRKPAVKEVEEIEQEEVWTPLEALEGDSGTKRDTQKRSQSKSDRRKQALVERDGAAEVMLQTRPVPVRHRKNSDVSDCEVLESALQPQPKRTGPIETVDIDDDQSEEGSNFCEIVAEPDKDSTFDFKRLLIQSRLVNLPSPLWGEHRDPRGHFVSFTRFNPDHPENNNVLVDRAVVFVDSLHPEVFVNGKKMELPEMFHVVETLLEVSQVIQHANNTVAPFPPIPTTLDET